MMPRDKPPRDAPLREMPPLAVPSRERVFYPIGSARRAARRITYIGRRSRDRGLRALGRRFNRTPHGRSRAVPEQDGYGWIADSSFWQSPEVVPLAVLRDERVVVVPGERGFGKSDAIDHEQDAPEVVVRLNLGDISAPRAHQLGQGPGGRG
jgi:hypothetical protein